MPNERVELPQNYYCVDCTDKDAIEKKAAGLLEKIGIGLSDIRRLAYNSGSKKRKSAVLPKIIAEQNGKIKTFVLPAPQDKKQENALGKIITTLGENTNLTLSGHFYTSGNTGIRHRKNRNNA